MQTIDRLNRRTVLKGIAAGLLTAGIQSGAQDPDSEPAWHRRMRIWDVHSHLEALPGDTPEAPIEILVRHMDRLGIERLILSQGFAQYMTHPTPAQVREGNDRG